MKNIDIQKFIDIPYATNIRCVRRKGTNGTQEFFTPYSIVKKMADKIPEKDWSDPTKTYLEPAAGNGQFVCFIIYRRIMSGIDPKTAFETCYATELMEDNVIEMKERCIDLLNQMEADFDESEIRSIMDKNFICTDFFKWDYKNWKPLNKALF